VRRGETRWYTFGLPDKRRPVLILSRDSVLPRLTEVVRKERLGAAIVRLDEARWPEIERALVTACGFVPKA
jgi:mRNA interferase MazF